MSKCTKCQLYRTSTAGKYSCVKFEGQGNDNADIMLVEEAPGYKEVVKRRFFAGDAGKRLHKELKKLGFSDNEIYITNVVKCRPPKNRTPSNKEIKACTVYLEEEIKKVKPKVIGALGNIPLQFFLDKKGITKLRGKKFWSAKFNCWVLPLYHPSYVIRFTNQAKQALEFTQDLGKLKRLVNKSPKAVTKTKYALADSKQKVSKLVDKLLTKDWVSYDLETTSLNPRLSKILCATFCYKPGTVFYVPLEDQRFVPDEKERFKIKEELKRFFSSDVKKIAQNGKFDMKQCLSHNMLVNNFKYDTAIAAYLLDESAPVNLNHLTLTYTDMEAYKDEVRNYIKGKKQFEISEKDYFRNSENPLYTKKGKKNVKYYRKSTILDTPKDLLIKYACKDADATFRVFQETKKLLKEKKLYGLFSKILMPLSSVLAKMELKGVLGDKEYVKKMDIRFQYKLKTLEKELQSNKAVKETLEKTGEDKFNFKSTKQLRVLLFDVLNFKPLRYSKKTQEPSTDKETLKTLAQKNKNKILKDMLQYRKAQKFYSTYIHSYNKLLKSSTDGRIHTNYNITGTATGRLSSNSPNLQNIPKQEKEAKIIRKVFIADQGYSFVAADYKQLEFKIFAHCVGDSDLIKVASEDDVHREYASRIFKIPATKISSKQRSLAKSAVFGGIMYGGGPWVVVNKFGIDFEEADKLINEFFNEFPAAEKYIDNQLKNVKKYGYVKNIFKRQRRLNGLFSKDEKARSHAERQAINARIQSSAADVVFASMNKLNKEVADKNCHLILNIHDDVTFLVKDSFLDEKIKQIKKVMENTVSLKLPLKVDIEVGKNLGEMEKLNI